jgi:hypothetical protein
VTSSGCRCGRASCSRHTGSIAKSATAVSTNSSPTRAIGLCDLADVAEQAAAFFGKDYPRDAESRSAALDGFARRQPTTDDDESWNPFTDLDERFFDLLGCDDGEDRFAAAADAYSAAGDGPR